MKSRATILIVMIFIHIIEVNCTNITALNKSFDTLLHCTSQLLNEQCENDAAIAYFQEDNIDEFVKEIRSAKVVVDLNKLVNTTSSFFKFPIYVLIINAVKEFDKFLKQYSMSQYWNPKARFIIAYSGKEEINTLFKMAWSQYIVNIIILYLNNAKVDIYTYFPYKDGKCGDDISKVFIQQCEAISFEDMFPNKIPWSVNGCMIKVAINNFVPFALSTNLLTNNPSEAGFEVVLIGNMLRRLNFTMDTIQLDGKMFSSRNPNGSYNGPAKYLYTGKCDVVFGHMWYIFEFLQDFDITYPYILDRSTWFVPTAKPNQQWKSLFFIFQNTLWLAVSLAFLCNIVVWWIFGRKVRDFNHCKSITLCILNSWSALLLLSFKLPRATVLRILVIFWVITGFLIATAYQSKLLSILTEPSYEPQITTLEELVASKYNIVYFDALYASPDKIVSEIDREIVKKGKSVTLEEYLIMMKNITNTGFLGHSVRVRYESLKYHTYPNGKPKLYEFKTAVAIGPISMQTTKGFPFLDHFDKLLLWFRQSGLIDKWMQSVGQPAAIKKLKNSHSVIKLTLNHFVGAFYLLLFGILSAFIAFLCELFFSKKCIWQ